MSTKKDNVQLYFERASQLFNSIYTGEKSSCGRLLDKMLRPDLKERFVLTLNTMQEIQPKSILDIGVGPGQYLKAYVDLAIPEITGLDFSEPMLELAKKLVGQIPSGVNLTYIIADFMEAEFDRKYDITIAMGVFDYVKEPQAFLEKMKSISEKAVLVSFPSISIWRTPIRKIRYKAKKCPVYFYKPDFIKKLSDDAGFKNAEVIKIKGSGMDYWVKFVC